MLFEITYDICNEYTDEKDIREIFEGSWDELVKYISSMADNGCYHIDTAAIGEEA